jgi:uncharacterized OB-fold protein
VSTTKQRPVAEELFTWPAERPRLKAAECVDCGMLSFPAQTHCVRCGGSECREKLLADRGTLWTFTTQNFRPPAPPYDGSDTAETFEPYTVGYIELPGELRVEARLTEPDVRRLAIGQLMAMTLVPYSVDPDGTEVLTFAFAPVAAEPEAQPESEPEQQEA